MALYYVLQVVNCVYFAGLLIVRYGYSSDTDLSDVLHAITIGYLNMSTIRDNAIIVSLVSISVSFFLQCGKTVSVGMHKPKVTLLVRNYIYSPISLSLTQADNSVLMGEGHLRKFICNYRGVCAKDCKDICVNLPVNFSLHTWNDLIYVKYPGRSM